MYINHIKNNAYLLQTRPEQRNEAQAAPSIDDWADDNPAAPPASTLLLKVYGLSPCGKERVPVKKEDWTGTLSFKWKNLQKKATTVFLEAKKKK